MQRKLVPILLVLTLIGVSVLGGASAQEAVPPQVIDVSPPPGAELLPEQPVVVTFDQPMDQGSVATALTVSRVLIESGEDPTSLNVPLPTATPDPLSSGSGGATSGGTTGGSAASGRGDQFEFTGELGGWDGVPVTLALNWTDARTLEIVPEEGWVRGGDYRVRIAGTAQTTSGAALGGEYHFEVKAQRFLEVVQVTPGADSLSVAVDTPIVVAFSRAVVPLVSTAQQSDLPMPITIVPDIAGLGEWINTSLFRFTPASPLAGGRSYTVTITPGLQAMDGTTLEDAFTWSFTTLPPQIAYVNLANRADVVADSDVVIEFTQPMDRPSTETAFSLTNADGSEVQGTFGWDQAARMMTFTPRERLDLETTYTISVDTTARGAGGEATLDVPYSTAFTSQPYPAVASVRPENGSTMGPYLNQISLTFRSPMNAETFRDRIVIEPEPSEVVPYISEYSPQTLSLQVRLEANTEYTVTLLAGAEDLLGNAIPEDYTFSFSTGELRPEVHPATNGDFMIASGYREDTRMAMSITGRGSVTFDLSQVSVEDIVWSSFGMYTDYAYNPGDIGNGLYSLSEGGGTLRSWTQEFDSGDTWGVAEEVLLASEEGGRLPLGLYLVNAYSPGITWYGDSMGFVLAVSTASLTVKRTPTEILVWVTDLQTGEALANVPISIYNGQTESLTDNIEGVTDENGLFRAPVDLRSNTTDTRWSTWDRPNRESFLLVTAGDPESDVFGAWYSTGETEMPSTQGYLYTDRPLYRPGETVYFRGVLRDREDMTYSIPDVDQVNVRLTDDYGQNTLSEISVEVSEFGTFSGTFTIPEDGGLGQYEIAVDWGNNPFYTTECYPYSYEGVNDFDCYDSYRQSITFNVSEFRVPEYEVIATPVTTDVLQGEAYSAQVSANYYFGGTVENAAVDYSVSYWSVGFSYPNDERITYTFSDPRYNTSENETAINRVPQPVSGSALTDSTGQFTLVQTPPSITAPTTLNASITMQVTDESGIVISDQTRLTIHPSEVYVGLARGTASRFADAGAAYPIRLITVTPDRQIVPNQAVELEVVEARWERQEISFGRYEWVQNEYPVTTGSVTTDANGQAAFEFTPPAGGVYFVRARTQDAQGRPNAAAYTVWALGDTGGRRMYWYAPAQAGNNLVLSLDPNGNQPGDTARVLIELPESGTWTAWITVERAEVMYSDVITIEGSSAVYELPLIEDFAPDASLLVTAIRGVTEDTPYAIYRVGRTDLRVAPVSRQLNVEVTPSARQFGPGEAVRYDVRVTDQQGNGVRAEVGLAVTDEAVLSLMPPNSGPIDHAFYGDQPNYVYTDIALAGLLDALTEAVLPAGGMGGGGGGGGEGANFNVRDDFEFTPLWATVVTDENGFGTVEVEMPDNLTRWRVDARVVSLETAVGDQVMNVTSTLPLLVRPAVPRFFVVGDRVELAALINNNSDTEQVVNAWVEASGVTLESEARQQVTIPAGGRARVAWQANVQDAAGVGLVFYAESEQGYQDAVQPMLANDDGLLPVYRYTAPDFVGTAGALLESGTRVEGVSLPPRFDETRGELTVRVDPTLAVTILDALQVQRDVTNRCNEIVVSSFLPNVVTYRTLTALNIEDAEMLEDLTALLEQAENTLSRSQRPDGGWGWCGINSSPYMTAYVLLGAGEARAAGFDFGMGVGGGGSTGGGTGGGGQSEPQGNPSGVIDVEAALEYLERNSQTINNDTPSWVLNGQIFSAYVRARLGDLSAADLRPYFDNRTEMTIAGRAYLLLSYLEVAPDAEQVTALRDDLVGLAILSATGVQWEEPVNDWQSWTSDTRTTALALLALTRAEPTHALLPGTVRWLLQARRGDVWSTTQETVWSLLAFTEWMQATGELDGNYEFTVTLNGSELTAGAVTPEQIRTDFTDPEQALIVPVADLDAQNLNRLEIVRGAGDGALYYTAHLNLRLYADEVDAISRGVTVTREYFLTDAQTPITTARVGDVVTVRLTINAPQSIYFFVLEDPLPAGLEAIDPMLLTNAGQADSPYLRPTQDDEYWYWGWWLFDSTQFRDHQTELSAEYLARGTYIYTYQARVVTPGQFQVLPAVGYAAYFPEVFGRTDGMLFTVLPAEGQ